SRLLRSSGGQEMQYSLSRICTVTVFGWFMSPAPELSGAKSWIRPSRGPFRSFQSVERVPRATPVHCAAAGDSVLSTARGAESAAPAGCSAIADRRLPWDIQMIEANAGGTRFDGLGSFAGARILGLHSRH